MFQTDGLLYTKKHILYRGETVGSTSKESVHWVSRRTSVLWLRMWLVKNSYSYMTSHFMGNVINTASRAGLYWPIYRQGNFKITEHEERVGLWRDFCAKSHSKNKTQ